MITKNKETIEKLQDLIRCLKEGNVDTYAEKKRLEATIKTSIEWCEDEIKDFEYIYKRNEYSIRKIPSERMKTISKEDKLYNDGARAIAKNQNVFLAKKLQQLTSHLKWLKEQNFVVSVEKIGEENE